MTLLQQQNLQFPSHSGEACSHRASVRFQNNSNNSRSTVSFLCLTVSAPQRCLGGAVNEKHCLKKKCVVLNESKDPALVLCPADPFKGFWPDASFNDTTVSISNGGNLVPFLNMDTEPWRSASHNKDIYEVHSPPPP